MRCQFNAAPGGHLADQLSDAPRFRINHQADGFSLAVVAKLEQQDLRAFALFAQRRHETPTPDFRAVRSISALTAFNPCWIRSIRSVPTPMRMKPSQLFPYPRPGTA